MNESDIDVETHWDGNADQWTRDVRAGFDIYRDHFTLPAFLEFIPAIDGLQVVDLGCGEGSNTRRFAKLGATMTGVDLSGKMISHALAQEAAEPLGISYRQASFANLASFAANSFDAALSTLAFMDSPDFDSAMREVHRILKPGGFVAFSILHPCSITPVMHWERDEDGRATGLVTARYFDDTPFNEEWRFSSRPADSDAIPFSVPRFPRTLSSYINAVAASGLRIMQIDEPQPGDTAVRKYNLGRWRDIAPFLLMVLAEKT